MAEIFPRVRGDPMIGTGRVNYLKLQYRRCPLALRTRQPERAATRDSRRTFLQAPFQSYVRVNGRMALRLRRHNDPIVVPWVSRRDRQKFRHVCSFWQCHDGNALVTLEGWQERTVQRHRGGM
jgi:hypothetical protein